jgi:hypothetical protein
MKVYIPDELEEEFKRTSMEVHGYGRGSISKAAAEAIQEWTAEHQAIQKHFNAPRDPVKVMRGMLKHVKLTSVELQHEATRVRARRTLGAK